MRKYFYIYDEMIWKIFKKIGILLNVGFHSRIIRIFIYIYWICKEIFFFGNGFEMR